MRPVQPPTHLQLALGQLARSLHHQAHGEHRNRVHQPSRETPEAVAEYKCRYGQDPPRGFDDWWAYVKENSFKLMDEFDAIAEDLEPFWALSGEELRRRTFQVRWFCYFESALKLSTVGALAFHRPRAHSGRKCVCRQDRKSVRSQRTLSPIPRVP